MHTSKIDMCIFCTVLCYCTISILCIFKGYLSNVVGIYTPIENIF